MYLRILKKHEEQGDTDKVKENDWLIKTTLKSETDMRCWNKEINMSTVKNSAGLSSEEVDQRQNDKKKS